MVVSITNTPSPVTHLLKITSLVAPANAAYLSAFSTNRVAVASRLELHLPAANTQQATSKQADRSMNRPEDQHPVVFGTPIADARLPQLAHLAPFHPRVDLSKNRKTNEKRV